MKKLILSILAMALYGNVLATQQTLSNSPAGVITPANANFSELYGNNPINLKTQGACGLTDGTSIFNAAATLASSSGRAIYIPGGCTINHSGTLTISGVKLYGDGITSILNATDLTATAPNLALILDGSGTSVRGINFTTSNTTVTRASAKNSSAITAAAGLTNYSIDHNYFTSQFAATDIQIGFGTGSNGDVSFNQVIVGPLSNAFIFQSNALGTGPNNVNIHDNIINGGGDTCIELTYAVQYINVIGNQLTGCGSHGIGVIGAVHVNIDGNTITSPVHRGIDLETAGAFTLTDIADISIVGNTIIGAALDAGIWANGSTVHPVRDVVIASNTIEVTTATDGIKIGSCDTCNSGSIKNNRITVSDNVVTGDGINAQRGIELRGVNDAQVQGNTITGMLNEGIRTLIGNSGSGRINGNQLSNLSLAGSGSFAAINLANPGFAHVNVSNNSYTAGANAVSHFLVCTASYDLWATQNIGSDVSISGCTLNAIPASSFPALTGDVTSAGGTLATTIAAGSVTLADHANLAANSIMGNNTGSPATPIALTATQARSLLATGYILSQSSIPFIYPPSGFFANNGVLVIGQAPSSAATVSFSATSGTGVTATFSAATLLGTAADVGRIVTILDTTYKYATITAQSSTTVATVTLTGTLSGTGPFANNALWLSGTPTTNTSAFSVPLDATYPSAYMFFPASAIVSGSAAGWYYCAMASSTQGTCFNNTYSSGTPTIPGSPTAFSTTGPGAYTSGVGTPQTAISVSLPGNSLGINGDLYINSVFSNNNSAGQKNSLIVYGATTHMNITPSTTVGTVGEVWMGNAGVANVQTSGANNGTVVHHGVEDSTAAKNVIIKETTATATDWTIIEGYTYRVFPAN